MGAAESITPLKQLLDLLMSASWMLSTYDCSLLLQEVTCHAGIDQIAIDSRRIDSQHALLFLLGNSQWPTNSSLVANKGTRYALAKRMDM